MHFDLDKARIMKLEEMQKIWVLKLTKHTSLNRRREVLSIKDFIFPQI